MNPDLVVEMKGALTDIGDLRVTDDSAGRILNLICDELLAECRAYRAHEVLSIDTSAIIRKAFVHLLGSSNLVGSARARFLMLASQAMRIAMVDCATRYLSEMEQGASGPKGTARQTAADGGVLVFDPDRARLMIRLDKAIGSLEVEGGRSVRMAEGLLFGGMSHAEIADALAEDRDTVRRELPSVQIHLYRAMNIDASQVDGGPER